MYGLAPNENSSGDLLTFMASSNKLQQLSLQQIGLG